MRATYQAQGQNQETVEVTVSFSGEQVAVLFPGGRILGLGGETIVCRGGQGSQTTCFTVPPAQGGQSLLTSLGGLAPYFREAAGVTDGEGGVATPTEIAGRSATCSSRDLPQPSPAPSPAGPTSTVEVCADDETGIPLLVEQTAGDSTTTLLKAVAVGEPREADFEPPVEPQPMPTGQPPGGSTGQSGSSQSGPPPTSQPSPAS